MFVSLNHNYMAILKIYNPIVSEDQKEALYWFAGIDGVCFKDVDEFIGGISPDDDTIDLRLHCAGGDVHEGWAIVDKLRATGKKITATIEGDCASMATVVLLAASVRRGQPHASLLIHEPYYPEYTLADAYRADDLEALATSLRDDTKKILDFYVERTGADRAELEALMAEDKFIDMERAKTLGFIHEILPPKSAAAGGNMAARAAAWNDKKNNSKTNNFTMKHNQKKEGKSALRNALAVIACALGIDGSASSVNYELNTESGETITIDKPAGEYPAVGDSASPDGEHKMPDGTVIVIQDGIIVEIRDAEDDNHEPDPDENDDELSQAQARIAELEAENAALRANARTTEDRRILNLVQIAGGVEWLEKARSEYKPASRQATARQRNGEPTQPQSRVQRRIAELEAKNNKE